MSKYINEHIINYAQARYLDFDLFAKLENVKITTKFWTDYKNILSLR